MDQSALAQPQVEDDFSFDTLSETVPDGKMIVSLLSPVQVSELWGPIQHALQKTVGVEPYSDHETQLRAALSTGGMQAWVIWQRQDKEVSLYGLMITQKTFDPFFGVTQLLIATLYGYKNLDNHV